VTLEAIGLAFDHRRVFNRRLMAPKTVATQDIFPLRRDEDRRGIVPQGFVKEIVEAGLDLVGYLHGDVGGRQVAFDAGELLMVRLLPAIPDMIHAVAGGAETGVSRGVIPSRHQCRENHADNDSRPQNHHGRKTKLTSWVH